LLCCTAAQNSSVPLQVVADCALALAICTSGSARTHHPPTPVTVSRGGVGLQRGDEISRERETACCRAVVPPSPDRDADPDRHMGMMERLFANMSHNGTNLA
jgi:hypothetical protein